MKHGVSLSMHYLDDFLTAEKANSEQCLEVIQSREFTGILLKVEKTLPTSYF